MILDQLDKDLLQAEACQFGLCLIWLIWLLGLKISLSNVGYQNK